MPEDVPLGTLLRRHRRAAGMTLEEVAETSGVSARAISDMERGRERRAPWVSGFCELPRGAADFTTWPWFPTPMRPRTS